MSRYPHYRPPRKGPRLSQLPMEVLELVCRCLGFADTCSIRLVCKSFNTAASRHFKGVTYSSVRSDLSMEGLRMLEGIPRNEALRLYC